MHLFLILCCILFPSLSHYRHRRVRELNLTGCWNIEDVSTLGHVERLNLSGCGRIHDISGLAVAGATIKHLILASNRRLALPLDSSSSLSHLHQISLSDCIQVTDVSALCGIMSYHPTRKESNNIGFMLVYMSIDGEAMYASSF